MSLLLLFVARSALGALALSGSRRSCGFWASCSRLELLLLCFGLAVLAVLLASPVLALAALALC